MHIITNGFTQVQQTKISCCGLSPYFEKLITSEMAGANKPDPRIFSFALKETNSAASGSLMIGDTFQVDIQGAKNAGMDQAWFNPYGSNAEAAATYEVKDLRELLQIL